MIKWFYILMIFCIAGCKGVEYLDDNANLEERRNKEIQNFPNSWQGKYVGKLQIFNAGNSIPSQEVDMELIIEQVDLDSNKFEWKIIYGEDKIKGLRQYQLLVKNKEKGEFVMDERNSIFLDTQFMDGKLISRFSVMGNLILATYEKVGNYIHFEIISGNEKAKKLTGGKDDVPKVNLYNTKVYQKAKLKKILEY